MPKYRIFNPSFFLRRSSWNVLSWLVRVEFRVAHHSIFPTATSCLKRTIIIKVPPFLETPIVTTQTALYLHTPRGPDRDQQLSSAGYCFEVMATPSNPDPSNKCNVGQVKLMNGEQRSKRPLTVHAKTPRDQPDDVKIGGYCHFGNQS